MSSVNVHEMHRLAGESFHCDSCGEPTVCEHGTCVTCLREGEPCPQCGERGTMKHGDPDDCRSPECLSDKVDAAEYLMGDR